ncbi:carboxymuconolactone decarboxylase family protein [Erythrobacter alti]|uniref:carboxymuconolactone decarboxylase family protein n=1 Tax=Erythrobacter alti TaxID=1896145 RepID=UPI0030F3ED24
MANEFETGLNLFGEIYGEQAATNCRAYAESDSFGSKQAEFAMAWAFGSVWSREGLERKMRSCVVLGMMIALRQSDEIYHHTRMALENGLTRGEIEEVLLTAVPYCGLPASNVAKAAMQKAFDEIDG